MKKKFLLVMSGCLLLSTGMTAQTKSASIVVNANTRYQHIDGFGGTGMNGQWADVYTKENVEKLWGQGENQIGLNIMRLRINPNESGWGEYGNPVRWARKINPSLQVFATPWTPPKKYKTQNTNKYQNDFGTTVWPLYLHPWGGEGSNGGAINPKYYEEFADFLERYRQTMAKKGAPIDMISIQNESDYTPTATDDGVEHASYESCIYSPSEMAAMVKAARAKVDPSCKIMGPECFGWGQQNYNYKLLSIKDAVDNIDVWGNHLYGTNDWSFVNTVTSKTGKPMWMTEFLIDYDREKYNGEFSAEYPMVESIEKALAAGYSAYVYYGMTNDFFACNHGGSDSELWKRAYVFSHYAKYATGKTRVKSTLTDTTKKLIGGSTYVSENTDTVTVFILNPTSDTYNMILGLPFIPAKITQIATGDNVNKLVTDVTDKFGNNTQRPKVTLMPGVFYTFQFTKEKSEEPDMASSPKLPTYGNPLSDTQFMADPTAIEYDGRLYVYATNDQQEFDVSSGIQSNTYGKITQLVCLSTADMVNWTNHGIIDVKAAAPWIWTSWAPSVVSRVEGDGKTHFYMYFTNSAAGIGVLTATSPLGPWTDPLGKPLVDKNTPGIGNISQIIDPGVAIKPDGSEAYLTFGGGDITGTELQPGNVRIVKLGDDMISFASDIAVISAPCQFEANELNYIGDKWVYSYCTRWSIASDWSSYSKATAPSACSMVYMTATDPLADDWTYRGVMMPNPGNLGYPYGNNHTHLQKFGDTYYLFYHTQWLERQLGYSGGYRNLQVNKIIVAENVAKIPTLTESRASLTGVSQITTARVNPYVEQSGKMSAVAAKNWWMVRGVDFAAEGSPARSITMKAKGTGVLEVRAGSDNMEEAEVIATITFSGKSEQEVTAKLTAEKAEFEPYLYFVLTNNMGVEVTSWQFSSNDVVDGIEDISVTSETDTDAVEHYSITGIRHNGKQPGVDIVRDKNGKVTKRIIMK